MAYQLNSAKDSRGDEHLFMERFNQNRVAIEAYKRTHGGDLEGAYQAVTGQPWPAGRSVKINNDVPEMTKDRTVKSVMGKYVAPIGAGALTALTLGGAAPSLAGLFGGGGTAGAAGTTMPAAITGLAGSGAGLAPIGTVAGLGGGATSAAAGAASKPGLWSRIGSFFKGGAGEQGRRGVGELISGAAGQYSQGLASNRGTMAELQLDQNTALEKELIAREQEKRDAQASAYKNAMMGSLASNWKSPIGPPGINVIRFGGAEGPANVQNRAAGSALYDQAMARMNLPDLQKPTGMPDYRNMATDPEFLKNLKAGKTEKGLGWASVITPFLGR